jgi:hypothetical protein
MANIKNFGLSGISADVQFGKAGGRVVYDAGNSVFKVTQADGTTLDNIRVATTPANANDAASKAYVDSKASNTAGTVQTELDATQVGAGLGATGAYTANGEANYIAAATSLKDADNKLDAALKAVDTAYKAADTTLTTNLAAEATARFDGDADLQGQLDDEVTRAVAAESGLASDISAEVTRATNAEGVLTTNLAAEVTRATDAEGVLTTNLAAEVTRATDAETALDGRLDIVEGGAEVVGSIAKALADAKAYTDIQVNAHDSTDEITEGTTNLYFTDARARASISVTDNGGDGALSYDSATGVISYTGPSALETQAHFSAGTGVHYSAGEFSIGQAVETTSNVQFANGTFTGNLSVTGNVSIGGSITVAQSANVVAAFTGNEMTLSGDLTVEGSTNLNELVTVVSAADTANANPAVNVFHVTSKDGDELFEVRQNGDTVIGGVLTVNGSGTSKFAGDVAIGGNATVQGGLTVSGDATFLATITGSTMSMAGDVAVTGNLTVEGNTTIGNADADQIVFVADVASNFLPDAAETYNLGATGKEWNNVYAANVYTGTLTVDTLTLTTGISGLALDGLDDVVITDVATNQIIAWDGTKWVNIDNVNVNGSLTVAGDINAEANIVLNSDVTDAPIDDAIILVNRGTSSDVALKWNETTDQWEVTNDGTNYTALSITAGTGVAVSSTGVVSIGQAVETTSDVTFNDVTVNGVLNSDDITANTVTITGNLVVNGTTTTVNTETIALADNIIVLNSNAVGSATQDAGIEVERGSDDNVSLVWDESNNRWTVGGETFVAGAFIGDLTGNVTGNLTGNVTGQVSSIANHTTDALAEGSTRLYYTDGRVAAYLLANAFATEAYTDTKVADKNSFVVRANIGTSGAIGTIANVNGKTYYVSRVTVKVTSAYDATVSISDGANTLMTAAEIEENVVGTYVAELPFATATTKGSTISLVSAATAGAATVTVEYVQL